MLESPYFSKVRLSSSGFTLAELLVVVLVIGVLTAIAIPNYVAAQDRSRCAALKYCMRSVQIAAETYATDAGGYAPSLEDLHPYFAGGSNSVGGTPGAWPANPFNDDNFGLPDPPDDDASITDVKAARAQPAGTFIDDPGGIVYDHALAPDSYAIWGCGGDGKCFGSGKGQLILSNQ